MKKTKLFLLLMLLTIGTLSSYAQVTTSSITGRVTNGKDPLIGATVVAVHQPSGSKYGVVTNTDGYYTIQGARSGGPYTVEVTYVGYTKAMYENITLHLGDNYSLNVALKEASQTLGDVVVTAPRTIERAGTNTNISSRQIESLPTVQRSIYDFTRLSPYAGGNYSFAGQDGRYNNITIDGAAFNNYFGLSANNLPGGDSQPISLDAIQEISVNVAPYNITQSSFTGASINAVTKSGDNTFQGSAYAYFRPGSFNGDHIGSVTIPNATTSSKQTYGLRLGGPIIKDKLFFFVNGEFERKVFPSNAYSPSSTGTGDVSTLTARTSATDLQAVKDYLISKYNYDPGVYQNFNNFISQNFKVLGRVDWNVDDKNKVTVRYNYVKSYNDILTNAQSGGSPSLSVGRSSVSSVAFSNAFYRMNNSVASITGEWNSQFASALSNKLLANYTSSTDRRTTPSSQLFPFVDIFSGGSPYMSFGTELFSYNNQVVTNTFNVFDNLTYNIGAHTITGGISYDNYYFGNNYMREGTSYYRYASVADFLNNATPTQIAYQYGYNGVDNPCAAKVSFAIGSIYLQDEWKILPNLKLNYGVRVEKPFFKNKLPDNSAIDAFEFYNKYHLNTGTWPGMKPTFNPRIGFNWDVYNDRSLVFRGGSGIFTGLLPFVWFTNQPGANGMIQSPEIIATTIPKGTTFEPNYKNLQNNPLFQSSVGTLPKSSVAVAEVGKNFKMPQVWRSSLAADIKLPQDVLLTVEGLYTKDINAVVQTNVNLPDAQTTFTGADTRQRWTSNKINSTIASAMILGNTGQGYAYSLSGQLKKTFSFGLSAMLAYTYNMSKDVSPNPGSTAASAWSSNVAVNSLNSPGLSYSGFSVPHRLTGSLSYKISYAKHFASTFSLFYNGAPQGRKSFTFTNDLNGDGNSSDLMYIPTKAQLDDGSFKFVDATGKDAQGNTVVLMTAQDEKDAFWSLIQSNSYLKSHAGKYVDRFGYVMPWVHNVDFKFVEDVYTNIGKNKNTLQISFDVLNIGNMINSNWGTYKTMNSMSYDNIRLLTSAGTNADGLPSYTLNTLNFGKNNLSGAQNFVANSTWTNALANAWSAMLGIRLIF